MRKLLQMKFMLLLCALIVGSGTMWAGAPYKLTKVTSVEAGGLYVFEQDGYVMNNTVSSSALQTTNNYKTTNLEGDETYVWTLEAATNGYYLKNVSKSSTPYLNNTSSTNVSFGNKTSVWSFEFTNDEALISNTSNNNRFLGYTNATSHAYKAYATNNLNSNPHAIIVYKLEEQSSSATLVSISVDATNAKTEFYVNEDFTHSGVTVTAYYENNTSADVTTSATFSTPDMTTTGDKTVTISYSEGENTVYGNYSINVKAIPTYTVTLGDDNSTLTETTGGAGVTLPTRSAVGSYTFAGWSETNVSEEITTAPTIIPAGEYYPTADITLYPVYTKTIGEGGGVTHETASVTIADYATANNWTSGNRYTSITLDKNVTATGKDNGNNSKYYSSSPGTWRHYASDSGEITISTTSGTLTKVTITYSGNTIKYGDSDVTSGTAIDVSGNSAVFTVSGSSSNSQVSAISVDYDVTGSGTTYYWSSPVAAAVETPAIVVAENPFLFSTTATITCATDGATIKYSYDGENWSDYSEALTITETKTIYAKAIKDSQESSVAQVTATKNLAEPTVTVSGDLTLNLDGETNVNAGTLTAAVTYNDAAVEGATVTWSSDKPAIATIDATTGAVTLISTGEVTFTATYAANSDYAEATGTKTVTVIDSKAPGTENNPYTVAQAIDAIDNNGNVTAVYVKGIVSQVDSYNGTYHSITYWISEDGTTTNQFEVYSGKGIGGANFSSIDDIQVGDVVVVKGNIKKYNSTYEFDYNNQLVSLQRPVVPTITATETSYTVDAHSYPGTGVLQAVTFTFNEGIATTGDTPFDAYLCDANGNVATYDWINNTYYQGNAQLGIYEIVCTFKDNEETTPRTAYMKIHGKDNDGNDVYSNLVTITQKGQAITRTYRKVTTTAEITSGNYLIVYENGSVAFDGSLETLDATSNTQAVEISDKNEIETDKNIYFTINLDDGTLRSASARYIGQDAAGNGLSQSLTTEYKNTFSCDINGNAVITGKGGCTLRFNSTNNQNRFRYYVNGQQAIQLYKEVTDVEKMVISIASACTDGTKCYSTFSSQNPFVVPEGLTVSEVGITDKGTIVVENYETGATVPAFTGVMVSAAEGGFYEVTVPASQGGSHVIAGEGNRLRPTIVGGYNGITEGTMLESNPNCKFFRLTMQGATATNPGKIGFWYGAEDGGAFDIAGNKAYLAVPASVAGARSGFAFDDETTGISQIENGKLKIENYYDLQGRKVSKPGKGLYIVNGKKVVIK